MLRPFGELGVTLELHTAPGGTRVTMDEEPVAGPIEHVPGAGLALDGRNVLSLRKLKNLAERS